MSGSRTSALVTGATGFLGGWLSRRLRERGWNVTGLGRNPESGAALVNDGIRFVRGDLADAAAVIAACAGQSVVFHCGALSSPWGRYSDFFRANVLGTRHVLAGCKQHRVRRLIHVSTPSIYFNFCDQLNIHESQPPAPHPANHYVRTKLLAEAEVDLAAGALEVITLRPRALFGPGDTTLLPRLIRANGSRGFPLIGAGDPLMDITSVYNVVDALVLAADAPSGALGRKFNITNGEPWPRSRLLATLFAELGEPFRARPLSWEKARRLAGFLELVSKVFTLGRWEPPLTRYTAGVLAKSQTLDISEARRWLNYRPRVNIADGLREFAAWWKEKAKP